MTLEQVKQLDAGAWFSPNFVGERVPTLDEVLSLARGRANVMIELKGRKVPLLPPLVAQAVERHQMRDQVLVSSFYAGPLDAMRSLAPNLAIGALILPTNSPTKRAQSLRASMAQAFYKSVDAVSVKAAHAAGLKVHVWTVNQPEDMVRMAKAGVDGIITDDVATCQQVLQDVFAAPPVPPSGQPSVPPAAPTPQPEVPEARR
jgi:glycerophosphoryl diester phosphodiesterase